MRSDSWWTETQETQPECIVCPQLPTCPRSCDLQSESPLRLPHTLIRGSVNQQPGRKCEGRRAGPYNRLWIEAEDSGGQGVSDWRRPAPLGSVCLRSAADTQWQTWITQLPVSLMMLYANDFLLSPSHFLQAGPRTSRRIQRLRQKSVPVIHSSSFPMHDDSWCIWMNHPQFSTLMHTATFPHLVIQKQSTYIKSFIFSVWPTSVHKHLQKQNINPCTEHLMCSVIHENLILIQKTWYLRYGTHSKVDSSCFINLTWCSLSLSWSRFYTLRVSRPVRDSQQVLSIRQVPQGVTDWNTGCSFFSICCWFLPPSAIFPDINYISLMFTHNSVQ